MYSQESTTIECPYCGEAIELLIDTSVPSQEYIEDCQVCCRPITVLVAIGNDESIDVRVRDENSC